MSLRDMKLFVVIVEDPESGIVELCYQGGREPFICTEQFSAIRLAQQLSRDNPGIEYVVRELKPSE